MSISHLSYKIDIGISNPFVVMISHGLLVNQREIILNYVGTLEEIEE